MKYIKTHIYYQNITLISINWTSTSVFENNEYCLQHVDNVFWIHMWFGAISCIPYLTTRLTYEPAFNASS